MRAIDFEPTNGKEPPQVRPGDHNGSSETLDIDQMIPVQTIRHKDKARHADHQVQRETYEAIVIDRDNRIVNGHHRYDALIRAGEKVARVYKMLRSINELD